MSSIYVRMSGRLGKQLFQYAAAKYIQEMQGGTGFLILLRFIKRVKLSRRKLVLKIY